MLGIFLCSRFYLKSKLQACTQKVFRVFSSGRQTSKNVTGRHRSFSVQWLTLSAAIVQKVYLTHLKLLQISAPIWTEGLVDVKVPHFPVCFPPWYLPCSVTCVLFSAPSLMCCTCVTNYLPCSCVFKSMCFTLSCLLLAVIFSLVFNQSSSFSTFFTYHITCLSFCEKKTNRKNKNIPACKGPSQNVCLKILMQLLVTLFSANDIGILHTPKPVFIGTK